MTTAMGRWTKVLLVTTTMKSVVSRRDPINGIDDDGDGSIDEDPPADTNGDGCAGVCGVDDDGDGIDDEGARHDDDETVQATRTGTTRSSSS